MKTKLKHEIENAVVPRRIKWLIILFVSILFIPQLSIAQTVVETNGQLQVSGNRIVNESGEEVELAGCSLFWSNTDWGGEKYYNADVVDWLKEDWGAMIVRAAMGVDEDNGYIEYPEDNKARVETVVNAAISAGIYVIIDYHSHNAVSTWSESKSFFTEMAQKYGSYPNVIFEVFNEPLQVSWTDNIKPYAEDVISGIRTYSDNLVIVGTPTWSQDVDNVIGNAIDDSNVAYTLHFYAGTHGSSLRSKGDAALNAGLALFVTEWGTVNADGDGDVNETSTNEWVSWMKENKLSHCNWSINDKDEGASALVSGASSTGGWSDSDLTASGTLVKSIIQGYLGNDDGGDGLCEDAADVAISGATTLEAESYCESSGVEIESNSEGGENVGYIDTDDWMAYRINIPTAGTYTITYRVASLSGGGTLKFEEQGGATLYGTVDVPSTGDWQSWTTVSHEVDLAAGEQSVAIAAEVGGWNLDWFEISTTGCSYTEIPATLEAESYCEMSGVEVEDNSEGGENVGYIETGDWMAYHINVPSDGTYTITYRVASLSGGGTLKFEEQGGAVLYGTVDVPSTGAWQSWTTVSHTVSLSAGSQSVAIAAEVGGWNIDWFSITEAGSSAIIDNEENVLSLSKTSYGTLYPNPANDVIHLTFENNKIPEAISVYDLNGQNVLNQEVNENKVDLDISGLRPGVYMLQAGDIEYKVVKK